MSIRYRKERKKWEASTKINGQRVRKLFDLKSEAQGFLDLSCSHKHELSSGAPLTECVKRYYEDVSKKKSPITKGNEKRYFNLMAHFLVVERGIYSINEVKYSDALALQGWFSKPINYKGKRYVWKPQTVNRAFNAIRDFFVYFVREEVIESSPCAHLKNLKFEDNSRRPLKSEEFIRALHAAPEWFKPAFMFLYLTGSDPSSMSRLKWRDVNFEKGELTLRRKKGKGWRNVVLPLQGELFELLSKIFFPRTHEADHVFMCEGGKPLSPQWCSRVGNRSLRSAGIKDAVLYSTRHALASDLTDANVSTDIVRRLLGHASITTTQRYSKPEMSSLESALRLVRGPTVPPICHQNATKGEIDPSPDSNKGGASN